MSIPRKCRHFNGIQHKRCEQGEAYSQWLQQKLALPCLPDTRICDRPLGECSLRSLMSDAELQDEVTMHDQENQVRFIIKPHSNSSQKCIGTYPEGVSREQVEKHVKGTFGGRFESFGGGHFTYIAYTD